MSGGTGEPPGTGLFDLAEVYEAAHDVVSDSLSWRLPEARWARVMEILQLMDEAISAGDPVALDNGTVELELAGPVRITRIGTTQQVPPPPTVLERLTRTARVLAGGPDKGEKRPSPQQPS
jgi:CATRA-Associated Small Protein